MKWLEQHMNLIYEWLLTFSNKKSLFSSKRIERFAIFSTMLILTMYFMVKGIYDCKLGATDFMIVVAGWLGYAGFNTVQIKKDTNDTPTE